MFDYNIFDFMYKQSYVANFLRTYINIHVHWLKVNATNSALSSIAIALLALILVYRAIKMTYFDQKT